LNLPLDETWWDPLSPAYDARRTARLRDPLLALIERDVSFSLDALVQGYDYPGGVRLESLVVELDEEPEDGEAIDDDWYFKLEGSGFRVVLYAAGQGDVPLEERDFSVLAKGSVCLDEVVGESAAVEWLAMPPLPDGRGYR
jgi:hypothetical protein